MCHSVSDLDECIRFTNIPGGFAQYRAQIPLPDILPMAVLNDIEIQHDYRRSGLGRAALHTFFRDASRREAKLAFLRVGWSGDDPDAERAWRIEWYRREGFAELCNTAPHLTVPFMYRPL